MAVVSRTTLKSYFENGDVVSAAHFVDLVDSQANLFDTTAQAFQSEVYTPQLVAANVSASTASFTGMITVSAAAFTGRLRQGVSAATSAADSRGDILVVQESTVTNATAQIAFLPSTSNIAEFGVKILVGGSAAAGGVRVNVGNSDSRNYFGTITVSAGGIYAFTAVSASRLTGVSGRVEMVCSGASANTNAIGIVKYYQRV